MEKLKIVVTEDGSHTIYDEEKREHYHSTHGAVQESNHIFIQYGLLPKLKPDAHINILEVGFGTGLNCLLSYAELAQYNLFLKQINPCRITYHAIEPHPISSDLAGSLNYTASGLNPDLDKTFAGMHEVNEGRICLSGAFELRRYKSLFQDSKDTGYHYDLVYFDAFSPQTEPSLWTREVFERLFNVMNRDAFMVTYCSKGVVRRMLLECGFRIERLPGPPGKHEVLRAIRD